MKKTIKTAIEKNFVKIPFFIESHYIREKIIEPFVPPKPNEFERT